MKEMHRAVVEQHDTGATVEEIVRETGKDRSAIKAVLQRYNRNPGKNVTKHRFSDDQIAEIVRRYVEDGRGYRRIAGSMGFSEGSVRAVIQRRGLAPGKGNNGNQRIIPDAEAQRYARLIAHGEATYKDAARAFGVNYATARRRILPWRDGNTSPRNGKAKSPTDRHLSDRERKQIREAYEAGATVSALQQRFRRSETTIRRAIQDIRRPTTRVKDGEIARLYRQGVIRSIEGLARYTGHTPRAVRRSLERSGLVPANALDDAERLLNAGVSVEAIVERLEVNRDWLLPQLKARATRRRKKEILAEREA